MYKLTFEEHTSFGDFKGECILNKVEIKSNGACVIINGYDIKEEIYRHFVISLVTGKFSLINIERF